MVPAHPKSLWIVKDSRNKYERMIFGQFYGFCDPTEYKIGQILAKIAKKLAETPKILPEATKMVPIHPKLLWIVEDSQNKYRTMILDQFYRVSNPAEWKIGQILAKIVKNLAGTPKFYLRQLKWSLYIPNSSE